MMVKKLDIRHFSITLICDFLICHSLDCALLVHLLLRINSQCLVMSSSNSLLISIMQECSMSRLSDDVLRILFYWWLFLRKNDSFLQKKQPGKISSQKRVMHLILTHTLSYLLLLQQLHSRTSSRKNLLKSELIRMRFEILWIEKEQ